MATVGLRLGAIASESFRKNPSDELLQQSSATGGAPWADASEPSWLREADDVDDVPGTSGLSWVLARALYVLDKRVGKPSWQAGVR